MAAEGEGEGCEGGACCTQQQTRSSRVAACGIKFLISFTSGECEHYKIKLESSSSTTGGSLASYSSPPSSTTLRTEVARTDTLAQRDFQLITMQIFGSKMREEREGAA